MQIEVYPIMGRRARFAGALASVDDFIYGEGAHRLPSSHNGSTIHDVTPVAFLTAEEFLHNPAYSLYCFDQAACRAIFVTLPPTVDLTKVPFVHQAQYEEALAVITVPFALFNQLARHLPEPRQPIFLYMSARSGSTLLSHALNASGEVSSLSEPDAITQFVHLRTQSHGRQMLSEEELTILANSTMRFLFRPGTAYTDCPLHHTQAVKFRSEGVRVMDLFQRAFPDATNIFLYRDALGWVNSFHRIFTKLGLAQSRSVDEWQQMYEGFLKVDLTDLRRYLAPDCQTLSLTEQLTLWWVANMEWYLGQWQQGTPVLAVRHSDLNTNSELTLEAIFRQCNLPPTSVQGALAAFAYDAQAGTALARENPNFGAELTISLQAVSEIVTILQRHPQLRHPNFWAPGTLDLTLFRNSRNLLQRGGKGKRNINASEWAKITS